MTGVAPGTADRLRAPLPGGKALDPAVRSGLFGPLALLCAVLFLVLYAGSGATDVWFAWTVAHPLTATTLGAGFGSAVVLLVLAALEPGWANARLAAFAPILLAGGSLLAARGPEGPRTAGLVVFEVGVRLWDAWLIGLVAVLVLTLVAVPVQLARRREGQGDVRTAPMPVWARVVAGLEGGALVEGGVAVFGGGSWFWPVTPLDLRVLAVWMVVIGALLLHGVVEGDLRRAAGGLAALVAFGFLALLGVAYYAGHLDWGSAWLFAAALLEVGS
ncbi:hypothetical protein GCM10023148_19550 [Actinokineospora soli]